MIDNKTIRQVVINSKLFPCSGTSYNEVSGSICNFETDLAEPLKTCEVSFTPIQDGTPSVAEPKEITGVSSVNVTSAGKNLFNDDFDDYSIPTGGNYYICVLNLPIGTYTGKATLKTGKTAVSGCVVLAARGGNKYPFTDGKTLINTDGNVFTRQWSVVSGDAFVLGFYGTSEQFASIIDAYEIQIEIGSTATAYAPYTTPTLTPVSLGQTVYNGSLDIISGTGVSDYGYLVLDGSEDWDLYSPQYGFAISIEGMKNGSAMKGYSNFLPTITSSANFGIRFGGASVNNNIYCCRIIGNIEGVTDVETWKTYLSTNNLIICYPLEVPETLSVEPQTINTLEGINNIWNDAGETTVKYAVSGGSCNGIMKFLPIFYPNGKGVKHHGSTF